VPPEILEPGIEVIRFLSQFRGPWVNAFFLAMSGIGSTVGYIVLFCFLWWGVSWKLGAKLYAALVLSVYLNAVIKDWVAQPRPFEYADVESVTRPDEFGFPSGHAQHAALIWPLLAVHFRKRWFTAFAMAMVFLIGFSRVQLGVHFPSDVLGGWLLGGILAAAYARWSDAAFERADRLSFETKLVLAVAVPMILTALHGTRTTAMVLGALAGALSGLVLARRQRLYPEDEPAPKRSERLLLGLVGLPALLLALLFLSPPETSRFYYLYLWALFATIGLWVSYLVPKLVGGARRAPSSPREERGERASEERASTDEAKT
jgi:membrane-associated phospholipid phosphatase